MKKYISILLMMIAAVTTANAQFTKIGGGLAAGTGVYFNNETDNSNYKTGLPAIFLTGIYEITLPVHVAPSFMYYFPHNSKTPLVNEESSKQVISCMMVDLNGHYVFNSLDRFEFYGLAGLNITFLKSKWIAEISNTTITTKESDNAFGLNLGAGTYIKLSEQIDMFGEAKYIVARYDQFLFKAGILINIGWLIKHEKQEM